VKADYEKDQVTVTYLASKTNPEMLISSLGEIDYKATVCNPEGCKSAKTNCKQPCNKPCNK
jgi:hypothetical protein